MVDNRILLKLKSVSPKILAFARILKVGIIWDHLSSYFLKLNFKNINFWLKRLKYYFSIWFIMSKNSFLMILNQKSVLLIFLAGKILRFIFFATFLFFLVSGAKDVAGYNSTQAVFFFLTFAVIDTTSQFLFREVYRFRTYVVNGDLDLILVKPVNALFRVLMGGADFIDFITIPPLYAVTYYVGSLLTPSPFQVFLYFLLIITGLLMTTAFHIIVMALGIVTLEVDHTIMIYRDITNMGRFPIDIYREPLRSALTYFIPVSLMISLPAKAFMGLAGFDFILFAIFAAFAFLYISLRFWNFALKKYSSASS